MYPGKKLRRSRDDKKIAGICGGLAEYFGIDSTIVRLFWGLMVISLGTGVLVYILAWIIMPKEE
ncbi:PspC domain-containing protein [Fuchsiella alkaliacetigena]|uniref:PspC domain-containing protein n=1 Tax=Fuchsiella alkaliacetigena TaxID=957042 RepID=UPI00200B0CFC|nr:PspC domain-containing protein [Fuchsiella alkaliacetigena]MCK8824078.1 PspC domain-containing protein [Fuchsiella alkaliacetigena]